MLRDIHNSVSPVITVVPAVRTATLAAGTGVDVQRWSAAEVVFNVGANGITFDATNKITLSLVESDDNSTFTDVAAGDLLGANVVLDANAKANKSYGIGYIGNKRYVAGKLTYAGTHGTGTAIGATVVLGAGRFGTAAVV